MIRLWLLLFGGWVGVLGMLEHRQAFVAAGVIWPWGLVLVVIVTAVVARAATDLHRVGAAWLALGWAGVLMAERLVGRGSYLVATDWLGWAFMVGALGVLGFEAVRASRLDP